MVISVTLSNACLLPSFNSWNLRRLARCIDCCIWSGLDWGGAGALILALRAIKVSLSVISLKRLNVLALGVIYIGYTTWAGLTIALILTVSIVNGLSKGRA